MQTRTRPSIRIGCAGWGIDRGRAHRFGDGPSTLARYATVFDCVEINSSFHRAHKPETYARWASAVPARFRFSVKLPKTVTHEMRLERTGDALARFAGEVAGLGAKLAGLLVQLPPSLAYDARVASTFFSMLRRRFDASIACEPRHASWFADRADGVWSRYEVARVAADPAAHPGAGDPAGAGAWQYWRLHGAPRMYYSSYEEASLQALATRLGAMARRSRPAWCIFDNTAHGHATANALRLRELIDEETG